MNHLQYENNVNHYERQQPLMSDCCLFAFLGLFLFVNSGAILKKWTHKCTIHYNKVNTKRRYPHDNIKQI